MANNSLETSNNDFTKNALEAVIRIGVVVLLASWCFQIIRPFVIPIVWGIIIAVAVHPAYFHVRVLLRERHRLAAVLVTLAMLVILVWPAVLLGGVLAKNVQGLMNHLRNGGLTVPPPPPGVEEWPLIGQPLTEFWSLASINLEAAVQQLEPHIMAVASWLLPAAAGAGLAILQFVVAVMIAGVLLAYAAAGHRLTHDIAKRLAGERGTGFADLAEATVRSVARGVLGVALIQSLFVGLGFVVVGMPAAGFWAFLCLVLGVVQIGVLPVTVPAAIYIFTTSDTVTGILFLVWSVFVSIIDNILKPLFLGRGLDVPMVVIFMGAIGGMLLSGIIGLFIGAVILALGYKLFLAWLEVDRPAVEGGSETP